jgi:hypothetical protein
MEQYGSSPALLRIDGRPVYYMYDSYRIPADAWAKLLTPDGELTVRGTHLDGEDQMTDRGIYYILHTMYSFAVPGLLELCDNMLFAVPELRGQQMTPVVDIPAEAPGTQQQD